MTTLDFLQAKRGDLLEVARRHGVTSVRIFGSVARGEDSPESDVDFLITTGPEVSSWFPAGLILDFEQLLGQRVGLREFAYPEGTYGTLTPRFGSNQP